MNMFEYVYMYITKEWCYYLSLQAFRKLQTLGLNEEHEKSLLVSGELLFMCLCMRHFCPSHRGC